MVPPQGYAGKKYKLVSQDGTRFIFTGRAIKQFYRYEFNFWSVGKGLNTLPYTTSNTLQLIKDWCDNDYGNLVADVSTIPAGFSVSRQARGFVEALVAANYMNEIGQQIRCLHIGDRVIQSDGLHVLLRRVKVQQLTAIYTPLIAPSFPLFTPKCDIIIINSAHWMSVQQLKAIDVRDIHIYGTNFSCEDMAMYLEWFVSHVYNKLEDLKLGLRENREWRRILSRLDGQAVKNKQVRQSHASFECMNGTKVVLGPLGKNLDPKMIQMKVSRPKD